MMKQKYSIHKDLSGISWFTPPFSRPVFPLANAFLELLSLQSDNEITVTKKMLRSHDGSIFKSLLIEPKNCARNMPCIVYMPGGGFALKPAPSHYRLAKEYCIRANCKMLMVRYRLAPKNKFPLTLEDCYSAYVWALNNAAGLGVNQNKIAIGGDSAGGNLAAACTLMARDNGLQLPCCQLLIYPVLDADMKTESMKRYTDTPMWNAPLNEKMWRFYLPANADRQNPYVSPLHAGTLSGLPPTYLEVAEVDCLHDEGGAYAKAIRAANVPVTFYEANGTIHGFEIMAASSIVAKSMDERTKFLRGHL